MTDEETLALKEMFSCLAMGDHMGDVNNGISYYVTRLGLCRKGDAPDDDPKPAVFAYWSEVRECWVFPWDDYDPEDV